VRVWAGTGGGGAKGKGTTKEWNKQQATATKTLKADYFDIYMVKMLELKKSAGATWSEPGVRQQAQMDMESYYFKEKTEPRLRELRDENAPPLSVNLTDTDGLEEVEQELGAESNDGDEEAAVVDQHD
jgi:hypothetical protein